MLRKVCFKCQTEKDITEFYKHKMMADGHVGKCKTCNRADVRENYQKNHDHYIAYERKRRPSRGLRRPNGNPITQQGHRARRPDKYKANQTVGNALRAGKLKKPSRCSECGSGQKQIHGHHDDYAKPLEVRWLCSTCHATLHKNLS
jgi:ribosomal protein S27AE